MTEQEATEACQKRNWDHFCHPFGIWFVGPGTDGGVVEVWGQGRSLEEAVQKALENE